MSKKSRHNRTAEPTAVGTPTQSILAKWKRQGGFIRFLDNNKGNYAVADLLEDGEDAWEEQAESLEQSDSVAFSGPAREEPQPQPAASDIVQVFVSHNLGNPLEMSLPRGLDGYARLEQLLLDEDERSRRRETRRATRRGTTARGARR